VTVAKLIKDILIIAPTHAKMRKCCIENNYNSCIECNDYPCKELQFELDHNPEAGKNLEKLKQETT
jgi:hypothetical protein